MPLDPAYVRFYDFIVHHTDELPLLQRLAAEAGQPARILECGAGSGRLATGLASTGHSVTALDQSPDMLARLSARLGRSDSPVRQRVTPLQADFTRPDADDVPDGAFDLVVFSSNTLALVPTADGQNRALAVALAKLRPGGWLYVEQLNPVAFVQEAFRQREVYHIETRRNPATGLQTARFMSFLHDVMQQRLIATTFIEEFPADAPSVRCSFVEILRYSTLPELTLRLAVAGFDRVDVAGGHNGEPADHRALKLVVTARKPDPSP